MPRELLPLLAGDRDGWAPVLPFDGGVKVRDDVFPLWLAAVVVRGCAAMLFPLTTAVVMVDTLLGVSPRLAERLLVEGFVAVAVGFGLVFDVLDLGFGLGFEASTEVCTLELADSCLAAL